MGILFHPVPQSVTPQAFLIALQSHGYEHIYEYLKSSKSQWEECVSFLHIKVKPPSGPWAMVHGHIGGQKCEGFSGGAKNTRLRKIGKRLNKSAFFPCMLRFLFLLAIILLFTKATKNTIFRKLKSMTIFLLDCSQNCEQIFFGIHNNTLAHPSE